MLRLCYDETSTRTKFEVELLVSDVREVKVQNSSNPFLLPNSLKLFASYIGLIILHSLSLYFFVQFGEFINLYLYVLVQ